MASVLSRSTQLSVREDVIDSVAPMVAQRSKEARTARLASEEKSYAGLYSVERRFKLIENEINSMSSEAGAKAESEAIARDLPRLAAAVDAALGAMERLKEVYAEGRIRAPVSGVVGRLNVSKGSVVRPGDSLMEIFHGTPYVLAYVPEGALYHVECGDRVQIKIGFILLAGRVTRIYPVTAQLPAEFRVSLRQPRRAQIVRIDFEPDQAYPSLFARAEISAADWPPQWLSRLWHSVVNGVRRPARGGACAEGAPTAQK